MAAAVGADAKAALQAAHAVELAELTKTAAMETQTTASGVGTADAAVSVRAARAGRSVR